MSNLNKRTILIYGRSDSGKTAQLGTLAEYVYKTLNKKTRIYSADRGGVDTIQPYVDVGIVEAILMGSSDPWIFLHNAVLGNVRNPAGQWVAGKNDDIGMFAFESFRSFAEAMLAWMAEQAGKGVNIGGGSNVSFKVVGDGQTLQIGGGNQTHYKVAQDKMTDEIWTSQKLNAPYIVWTSSVSKDEDPTSSGKVLGPDVIGKALTAEVPRWFNLTFRLDVLPAEGQKNERHLLYLGTHKDINAGNVAALGNLRMPLDAPPLEKIIIEPANIVEALKLLDGKKQAATDVIKKRLGIK